MKEKAIVAITTCPEPVAEELAQALVGERLAACVNQIPSVWSTFAWQGKVTRDRETLLVIKTTEQRYAALEARIRALHPYDLPEVLALPVQAGSEPYLDWMCLNSRPPEL
jgi:periplasmic divalent cation tolerance protein